MDFFEAFYDVRKVLYSNEMRNNIYELTVLLDMQDIPKGLETKHLEFITAYARRILSDLERAKAIEPKELD